MLLLLQLLLRLRPGCSRGAAAAEVLQCVATEMEEGLEGGLLRNGLSTAAWLSAGVGGSISVPRHIFDRGGGSSDDEAPLPLLPGSELVVSASPM